jgi:hypothetical protein
MKEMAGDGDGGKYRLASLERQESGYNSCDFKKLTKNSRKKRRWSF